MSNIKIDYQQIEITSVSSTDTDGSDYDMEAYVIPLNIPTEEVSSLLSDFSDQDENNPDADTSRAIARIVLSALKSKTDEG